MDKDTEKKEQGLSSIVFKLMSVVAFLLAALCLYLVFQSYRVSTQEESEKSRVVMILNTQETNVENQDFEIKEGNPVGEVISIEESFETLSEDRPIVQKPSFEEEKPFETTEHLFEAEQKVVVQPEMTEQENIFIQEEIKELLPSDAVESNVESDIDDKQTANENVMMEEIEKINDVSVQNEILEELPTNVESVETLSKSQDQSQTKEETDHPEEKPVAEVKKPAGYIAIVVDDMGINLPRTKEVIEIKAPLTSSFLTYGRHLNKLYHEAKESGHEIMVHAPMEPKSSADWAPDTLTVSMSDSEIENNFLKMLAKFGDADVQFVNNHMGSRLTENAQKLGVIMDVLAQKKLSFLDSRTTAATKGKELAVAKGVNYLKRDVFLDNRNDYQFIQAQLKRVEQIARKNGFAVAICHPKSQTIRALKNWVEHMENNDVKLVHISELMRLKEEKK